MKMISIIAAGIIIATEFFPALKGATTRLKAAVTLELKKRAKQTKSVYIARTADTWKLFSFHVTAVWACLFV